MSIVELPSQTASDRCEQPDQTAAIRGARLSELETPADPGRGSETAFSFGGGWLSRLPLEQPINRDERQDWSTYVASGSNRRCGGAMPAAARPPRRRSWCHTASGGRAFPAHGAVAARTGPCRAGPGRRRHGRAASRPGSLEPRIYQGIKQKTQRTEAVGDRPQQGLGQGDLTDMTGAAAQAGHDRNRAWPVTAGHDRAE